MKTDENRPALKCSFRWGWNVSDDTKFSTGILKNMKLQIFRLFNLNF